MSVNFAITGFDSVSPDATFVHEVVKSFLSHGSKIYTIPLDDIRVAVSMDVAPSATMEQLLSMGNKIGNIIVLWTIARAEGWAKGGRWEQLIDETMELKPQPSDKSLAGHAKLTAAWAMFGLLRAHAPHVPSVGRTQDVPRFISEILCEKRSVGVLGTDWSDSDPLNWSMDWIKHIDWTTIGPEFMSRIGLGLAGHRILTAFKDITPEGAGLQQYMEAYKGACYLAEKPPSWTVHPATRDPHLLATLGNINKNATNLILAIYTTKQVQEMHGSVFGKGVQPRSDPQHKRWLQWSVELVDKISFDPIFPTRSV